MGMSTDKLSEGDVAISYTSLLSYSISVCFPSESDVLLILVHFDSCSVNAVLEISKQHYKKDASSLM